MSDQERVTHDEALRIAEELHDLGGACYIPGLAALHKARDAIYEKLQVYIKQQYARRLCDEI